MGVMTMHHQPPHPGVEHAVPTDEVRAEALR
jgi:hypothetical protein